MDTSWDLERENETVFSYRFRKHNEATSRAQTKRCPFQHFSKSAPPRTTRLSQEWFSICLTSITSTSLANMIHPFSTFKQFWDRLIFYLVLFNSMAIPWLLAFKLNKGCNEANDEIEDSCVSTLERFVAIGMDVVFWIDMLISLRCGFVDEKMVIRMNDKEVLYRYCTRYLWIDLIANFPYYTIAANTTKEDTFEGRIAMNLYILPKLLRTMRAFRSLRESTFSPTISRIFKMVGSFLIASHWCGCIWYFIGRWEAETFGANTFTGDVSWVEVSLDEENSTYLKADLRTKYTAAVYWAITTMSTVGYGDIVPQTNIERVFTIVVQFLGATSAALILGHVAVLIANFNSSSQQFRDKRYTLDAYLKSTELSSELCKRARASLHHSWNLHRGMDHTTLLQDLPPNMKADILELMLTNDIQGAYLFENCDRLFIRALVTKLVPEMYTPSEVVYHRGDITTSMYYIRSGKVKMINGVSGVVVDVLSEGELFGEIELFGKLRRLCTIVALTAVDLQALTPRDLDKLMEDFPEYKDLLMDRCLKRRRALEARLSVEFHMEKQSTPCKNEALDIEKHEEMHYTKAKTNRQSRLKSAQMNSGTKKEDGLLDTARCVRPSPNLTKQHLQKRGQQSKDKSEDNTQSLLLLNLRHNLTALETTQDQFLDLIFDDYDSGIE